MGGGGMGGGTGGRNNQQSQQNQTIAADKTQITTCQAALTAATNTYATELAKFNANYVKTTAFADAQKAVNDATKEVENARAVVIAKLKATSPEYRTAVQKETDAQKKLDAINASGNRDQVFAQSKIKLDAGDAVSKLEAAALDKDEPYQAAKKKLAAASEALKAQRDALAAAVKADPGLTNLQTLIDTAKTDLDAAKAKLKADGG